MTTLPSCLGIARHTHTHTDVRVESHFDKEAAARQSAISGRGTSLWFRWSVEFRQTLSWTFLIPLVQYWILLLLPMHSAEECDLLFLCRCY